MSHILAVLGATGKQGSSVINHVLNNSKLSQKYKIRAITRDINSEASKQLAQKVEVVQGDVFNDASLEAAFTGVHTLFAMTNPDFGPNGLEVEYESVKTIADVAVNMGVEYIIFSTLPSPKEISGGKYIKVTPFEAKAKAEKYIRSLNIKSAFFSLGSFMENLQTFGAPRKAADDTWVLAQHISPDAQFNWIDASSDTGKFVSAILADPEKYKGKTFIASAQSYTWDEVAAIISKSTGKQVIYKQISVEAMREGMTSVGVPASAAESLIEALSFKEEYGDDLPSVEDLVAWNPELENAFGKFTTLEEYLEGHPLQLS